MSGAETDTDTQVIHADLVDACSQSCGCGDPGKEGECWYAESLAALSRLSGRVTELEQALRLVEWIYSHYEQETWCEVCGAKPEEGHADDCLIAKALAGSAGQEQA